jgi:hypothetical protein
MGTQTVWEIATKSRDHLEFGYRSSDKEGDLSVREEQPFSEDMLSFESPFDTRRMWPS